MPCHYHSLSLSLSISPLFWVQNDTETMPNDCLKITADFVKALFYIAELTVHLHVVLSSVLLRKQIVYWSRYIIVFRVKNFLPVVQSFPTYVPVYSSLGFPLPRLGVVSCLVSCLVLWAQSDTKDCIRAEHKLQSISKSFIPQVIRTLVFFFLKPHLNICLQFRNAKPGKP